MKYYGTTTNSFNIPESIKEKYDMQGVHQQYRLVVKAKSRAEANRIWKRITGRNSDVFLSNYTMETGNKKELELADLYGAIICKERSEYVELKVIVDEINRLRE